MFQEPLPVFSDFSLLITLRKGDGSFTLEAQAVYDEATIEADGYRDRQPQFTLKKQDATGFEEGDFIDHEGKTYRIDDALSDNAITTFRVTE